MIRSASDSFVLCSKRHTVFRGRAAEEAKLRPPPRYFFRPNAATVERGAPMRMAVTCRQVAVPDTGSPARVRFKEAVGRPCRFAFSDRRVGIETEKPVQNSN